MTGKNTTWNILPFSPCYPLDHLLSFFQSSFLTYRFFSSPQIAVTILRIKSDFDKDETPFDCKWICKIQGVLETGLV